MNRHLLRISLTALLMCLLMVFACASAVGEGNKAAADAKGEVAILSDSLGDDFVIEDSMIFDAGSSGGGASALSVDGEAGSAAKALTIMR